jgi:4-amino-4-deoxy-L-arabinose transferase-like glycosyltransferase
MNQLNLTLPEKTVPPEEIKTGPVKLPGFIRQNYLPILLGLTVLLAFFLRIYDIAGNPSGLNQDEAVNGVDALSLGQTLRDHHGNFLPVLLESFEDWASSLLTYLTVPFVWALGLSEFSVRLPVVLLGTGSVFLMFLYVKRLTNRPNLGLLAAFFLGIMPWHIIASRWAIPPDVVPFFLLLLLYVNSWVGPTETKLWKFGLIGLSAASGVYAYPTQKMFIPLLLGVFLFADFFNKIPLKLLVKKYLAVGMAFLLLTAPIYLLALLEPQKYNARFSAISIFSLNSNPVIEFLTRYFNYFNPVNIFDAPGNYLFLALFYYLGLTACIHKAIFRKSFFTVINRPNAFILLGWWLTFSIPASLTVDLNNPLRVIHGYPLTIIFSALGIAIVGDLLKARYKKLVPVLYLVVLVLSAYFLVFFSSVFFTQFNEDSRLSFQYGIEQFSEYLIQHKADFDNVTVDSHINQPYIYYLFYSKEDPHRYNYAQINYRKTGLSDLRGIPKLDNYLFARIPPETIADASEIFTVKDDKDFVYYKVYAKQRQWYVVIQYGNSYEPPA